MKNESTTEQRADRPITRRRFHRMAFGALCAAAAPATLTRPAVAGHHETASEDAPEWVTDIASNELLLSQVKYVAVSETEGKQCGNCALFLERQGNHGRCGLFQKGRVPETAWCTSWIQKPGT